MDELEFDMLPIKVKDIINTYDDNKDLYLECKRIKSELNLIGWDCEYDLGGQIYNINVNGVAYLN